VRARLVGPGDTAREESAFMTRGRSAARAGVAVLVLTLATSHVHAASPQEELWEASRNGDAKKVESLLAKGADVNARTSFGATALWLATYKERPAVVTLLLKKNADPDVRDTAWAQTPLDLAVGADGVETLVALLGGSPKGVDAALISTAADGKEPFVRALLEKAKITDEAKSAALAAVSPQAAAVADLLRGHGAKPLPALPTAPGPEPAVAGSYESREGRSFKVTVKDGLVVTRSAAGTIVFKPSAAGKFAGVAADASLTLRWQDGKPSGILLRHKQDEWDCVRSETVKLPTPTSPRVAEVRAPVATPRDWPSFRGPGATGVADGQHPPTTWDAEKGLNVRWKTPIPGLAHSCPVVCGNRVFVSTAVSGDPKSPFKPGLHGDNDSVKDFSVHSWRIYCLDKASGKILWEREAHKGVPRVDRNVKASQANATPATDGEHVAVVFGSEGLFCYDLSGNLLWRQDLGVLDVGQFNDPEYMWGAGSSPVIYRGLVIVQCDRPKDGFLAAYDVKSGKLAWRTPRDEPPSWSTPGLVEHAGRAELVVNGGHAIRGYDPQTGKELWRLTPSAESVIPTPFGAAGLIFVASAYGPIQPLYAIVPGATGDISPDGKNGSSASLAWQSKKGGVFIPTPIVYGGYLYVLTNRGILNAYEARTGREVYKQRLGGKDGYTASPVAADGRLYFTGDDGVIRVVKAGPTFELLSTNPVGEACLATPAISDGMFFVRARGTIFAFGGKEITPDASVR
jgi:outer membrane protein assembly factor BamB